jgi:hypothetical protein
VNFSAISRKNWLETLAITFDESPVGVAEILELTGDVDGQNGGNVGVDIRAEIYRQKTMRIMKL